MRDFLSAPGQLLDIRSPGEFAYAHIPGAENMPLFSNEERAEVGTCYTQIGKTEAFDLGLRLAAPKLSSFVNKARSHASVRLYCWRGGLRSSFIHNLFCMGSVPSIQLQGGYKAFRKWVLDILSRPWLLQILGGLTGSGKTERLRQMGKEGHQVIDLESLANHRGSVFGGIGMPAQPSNEHFENLLALQLFSLDPSKKIWLENESRLIGHVKIPDDFFILMRHAPRTLLNCSKEKRLERLVQTYGSYAPTELEKAISKIEKRLGSLRTKDAIKFLKEKDLYSCFSLLLEYYDKAY